MEKTLVLILQFVIYSPFLGYGQALVLSTLLLGVISYNSVLLIWCASTTQLLQYKHKIGLKMEQKSTLNEKYSSCSAPSKAASAAFSKAMSTI